MLKLSKINKPTTLTEAIEALRAPGAVALASGTELVAAPPGDAESAVDLSALGLNYIRENKGAVAIGATTTLADLAESPILRALANGVIAQAAHKSAASILRNQGTIGGTLIARADGILAVALLALDAQVTIARPELSTIPVGALLADKARLLRGALLVEVSMPMTNPRAALHTVARTPSDKPIVAVCAAARLDQSIARGVRIAMGGVAATAVRAEATERALEGQALSAALAASASTKAAEGLAPVGDFRGSAEYRREMATVLARRAIIELMAA